jgi:5-methylcytosine-specific restriction endonuclease McrA
MEMLNFRRCLVCEADISHKRANAVYCCRKHKSVAFGKRRDYKVAYERLKESRQKQALDYYRRNQERAKARMLKFQKDNKHLFCANSAKRRASKRQASPNWLSEDDRWLIKEIYETALARTKLTKIEWHVDHIVPLKHDLVCGLHVPWNLQVITASENISKHNRFENGR